MTIKNKLAELGIELGNPPAPVANYVAYVVESNLVTISGQVSLDNGQLIAGTLGQNMDKEQGYKAAKVCAINVISQLNQAVGGDLERVKRCVRLGIFVNSASDFTDQPEVGNGASDLIAEVFGDKGKHARAAVGVNTLPRGAAVEVEATFAIEG